MTAAYLREMEHARRDADELCDLLTTHAGEPRELTDRQLAQAIGLADTAHRALLAAMAAIHVTPAAPQPVTSRRGLELIGRAAPHAREQSAIFEGRCVRCRDGEKPCVQGNPNGCSWPHARND